MFVHVILPFLALWVVCIVLTYLGTKTLVFGANELRARHRLRRIRAFGAIRRSIIAERGDAPPMGNWRATIIEPGSIAPDLWTEVKDWELNLTAGAIVVRAPVRERWPCGCRKVAGSECWMHATVGRIDPNRTPCRSSYAQLCSCGLNCTPPNRGVWFGETNHPIKATPIAPAGMNDAYGPVPPWPRTRFVDPLPAVPPVLGPLPDNRFFDPRAQENIDFLATATFNNQIAAAQLAAAQAQQQSVLDQVLNFVAAYGSLLVLGGAGIAFTNRRGPK